MQTSLQVCDVSWFSTLKAAVTQCKKVIEQMLTNANISAGFHFCQLSKGSTGFIYLLDNWCDEKGFRHVNPDAHIRLQTRDHTFFHMLEENCWSESAASAFHMFPVTRWFRIFTIITSLILPTKKNHYLVTKVKALKRFCHITERCD